MSENNENEYSYKILLIGDSTVGKTCFFKKLLTGEFVEKLTRTINIDKKTLDLKMHDNKFVQFYIIDTIGINRLLSITQQFFDLADGIILIYDITNKNSFNGLQNWIDIIKEEITFEIPIILFGNKNDLEFSREVSKEEAEKFSKENNFMFFECSAKEVSQNNLINVFDTIANFVYENSERKKLEEEKRKRDLEEKNKKSSEMERVKKNLNILMKYISY